MLHLGTWLVLQVRDGAGEVGLELLKDGSAWGQGGRGQNFAVPGGKDSPSWIINAQTKAEPCLAVIWLLNCARVGKREDAFEPTQTL